MLGSHFELVTLHGRAVDNQYRARQIELVYTKSTNMENRLLVTDEPVEFEKHRLTFKTSGNYQPITDRCNMPQISGEQPEDHNMQPVGLGNTRF